MPYIDCVQSTTKCEDTDSMYSDDILKTILSLRLAATSGDEWEMDPPGKVLLVMLSLWKKCENLDEKYRKLDEEHWKLEKKFEMLEEKYEKLEKKCEKPHESLDCILETLQNNALTQRVTDILESILEVKGLRQQPQCQQASNIEQDNNGKPQNIIIPSLEEEEVDGRHRHNDSFTLATVEENITCSSEFSTGLFETDAAYEYTNAVNYISPPSPEEVMEVQPTESDMRPLLDNQGQRNPQYTKRLKSADPGPTEVFVDRAHTKTAECSHGLVIFTVSDEKDGKSQSTSRRLTPMNMCIDTFKHHTGPGPPFHCALVSTSRPGPESDVLLKEANPSLSSVHPPEGISILHEEEHIDCKKYYEALNKQPVGQKSTPDSVTVLYTLAGLSTDVKTPPTGRTATVQHTYRQPVQLPLTCSDWAEEEQRKCGD